MAELEPLLATLREGQRIGAIGPLDVEEAIEHSMRFVHALAGDATRVIDLGSGGGLPGLVIGWSRPDLRVTLVDRRSKRTDFLHRALHRLDLDERMVVITADVHDLGRMIAHAGAYDAVTARSFGAPDRTVRVALQFVSVGGEILVSDPPGSDRWPAVLAGDLGRQVVVIRSEGGVTVLGRRSANCGFT
jgi:16S rRNA (guanine527-N7)-methyltransferase